MECSHVSVLIYYHIEQHLRPLPRPLLIVIFCAKSHTIQAEGTRRSNSSEQLVHLLPDAQLLVDQLVAFAAQTLSSGRSTQKKQPTKPRE
jgi:hypothetical protein